MSESSDRNGEKIAATTFIFMGDPQCDRYRSPTSKYDYSQWGRLLGAAYERAAKAGPPVLVLAGDIVNRADRELEWDALAAAGGETLRKMRVFTAMGNRGRMPARDYRRRFGLPDGGPDWPGEEADPLFYSFDHGCCHFLVLDTNVIREEEPEGIRVLQDWIRRDLGACGKPVSFVLMHHPVFTVGTSPEDDERAEVLRRTVLPLLEEYGTDMILCGHQHLYCRTKPVFAGAEDPGLIQVMGVAGTKYFDAWEREEMECIREFVSVGTVFRVGENEIRMETIDPEGNVVDGLWRKVRPKKQDKKLLQQHL